MDQMKVKKGEVRYVRQQQHDVAAGILRTGADPRDIGQKARSDSRPISSTGKQED
jgi:hypothetical protein